MSLEKIQGTNEKKQGIYYVIDKASLLGEGGMGTVYKGTYVNESTGETREAAVKILKDLDDEELERARREASIRLRNDNLIEMYGFDEEIITGEIQKKKRYHVAMEFLDGITLEDFLEGKLEGASGEISPQIEDYYSLYQKDPRSFATKIVRNVLSGLMTLHDAGYIHRDIDPTNIMLTTDGRIKIIDFGIAKKIRNLGSGDRSLTRTGMFTGKARYAAPELVHGDVKHQNQTTDIYAVGILHYQCLVGHVPFEGPDYEVLQMQLTKNVPLREIKDKSLGAIISKATNKKQSKRYQSASEYRVALDNYSPNSILWNWAMIAAGISGLAIGAFLALMS